ncbi:MAG: hypothetical protein ACREOH_09010, partial [Candidatus Entotheonellia bacterium]
ATLLTRIAQHPPTDLACSIISFHEQVLGCHTYINQGRQAEEVVRGYGMLVQVLRDFAEALVVPFDVTAAVVFEELVAQRVRVGARGSCLAIGGAGLRDRGQVPVGLGGRSAADPPLKLAFLAVPRAPLRKPR